MKVKVSNYIQWFLVSLIPIAAMAAVAKPNYYNPIFDISILEEDTIKKDTSKNEKYKPSRRPKVNNSDRYGNPLTERPMSPILMPNPSNITTEVQLDTGNNYYIEEKVGESNYRSPSTMSFDEYSKLQQQNYMRNYWKTKSQGLDGESAVTGRSVIPKLYIGPTFDRIFGGNYVDIQPNGFVSLDFGIKSQRVNNPNYSLRQQRTPPQFDFDQQISMNVTGKIGEKATITSNFDTKSSFQFENNVKFEYTGFEEDIIKKIEVGNVNMPLNNTLIQGAQNLFGIKTQLQFGKLFVTGVASTQRGTREDIEIKGGSQRRNFEIRVDGYEDNRHFFLSHFFRNRYEEALRTLPNPTSGIQIPQNRVEVYVVNRTNSTDALRGIIALTDLGESKFESIRKDATKNVAGILGISAGSPEKPSDNSLNKLYEIIRTEKSQRNVLDLIKRLEALGLERGIDFERIDGARKLTERDYSVNSELGYVSLNVPLKTDEALAVAYQYTFRGRPYKVGELTEDYQDLNERQVVVLKLIRPNSIRTSIPMWNLMMKNIYPLGASGINRGNFQLRIIYRDDNTGLDNPNLQEGFRTKNIPLLQLFNMDILNPNNDPQPDGNFDYIEGLTMDSRYGRIIFPVLEPFGSFLNSKFEPTETSLREKYVYNELYTRTKSDASLTAGKNKFYIVGNYEASGGDAVNLNAIGVAQGSVTVTYGGKTLEEGVDYTVDYSTGNVSFLKEEYLNASSDIKISYEKDEFFTPTTKTLLGTRLDYKVNKNFNIGGTLLYLNERPLISRISVGDEPTRNMIWGADVNYSKDSRLLTRLVDRLPFIRTKEISNVSAMGEFAQLVPGTSNKNGGEGISYIDDFEGTETPIDLGRQPQNWKLGSTPVMIADRRDTTLDISYRRAKLAWYSVDQTAFYFNTGNRKPGNIGKDEVELNHYSRQIGFNEVLKGIQPSNIPTLQPTFDLAYFPNERGPYNYNPNLGSDGKLLGPGRNNWAGITRAITNDIDFDNINVEYIEFWLMDPFIKDKNGEVVVDGKTPGKNNTDMGGKLIFNLGNISEDVMRDSKHLFENGLPPDGDKSKVETSNWGNTPTRAYLNNAFESGSGARVNQDIGLDGLNDEEENIKFSDYLTSIESRVDANVFNEIRNDPSADNFEYFLGDNQDARDAKIIGRYKNFNNTQSNSPDNSNTTSTYTTSGSAYPDNEDLNKDNTLNELEEYYQYEIPINSNDLQLGKKYVVDKVDANGASWYLLRIPIREPTKVEGNIEGFKTMRFIRTIVTGFDNPVVLRMINFQMISSQWRKFADPRDYNKLREPSADTEGDGANTSFVVSTVNIEENGNYDNNNLGDRIPYVLPPGFTRDRDNSAIRERQLNEQSLRLCIENLEDGDARAVFKNVNFDFLNYKRLKMNLHAETQDNNTQTKDLTAFIRLGSDQFENFYEIEIPLFITPRGSTLPEDIWPDSNLIDIAFEQLANVKVERNSKGYSLNVPYTTEVGKHRVTVVGNPDYTSVQVAMIGIRNPRSSNNESPKSICIWANELRVSDFDNTAGWAATGRVNFKLADFATVTVSGRMSTYGFGGLQDRISERAREDTKQYFVSSNVNLDKFFPQKLGLKIPMLISYENEIMTPRYDPFDRDVRADKSVSRYTDEGQKDKYLKMMQDRRVRRSINFTNVGKVKTKEGAKNHLYDIENISLTYAYADEKRSTYLIEGFTDKTIKYGIAYNYSNEPKYFEPFKKSKPFSSPFLKAIKDFNIGLGPSTITVRGDLDRRFTKTLYRNFDFRNIDAPNTTSPYYQKAFTFTRNYDMRWNLTRNLAVDYTATAYAIIDEPAGEIGTKENTDSVMVNLKKLGRIKQFDQRAAITYKLPLDKLPITDWVDAQYRFATGYHWTAGSIAPNPNTKGQADTLGNLISNDREQSFVAKVNLTSLYNKSKFLKDLNKTAQQNRNQPNRNPQSNQASRQPNKEDTVKQKPVRDYKFLKNVLRLMTTVKSLDLNYTVTESTTLPGFLPKPTSFGMDEGYNAPGWDFVFGNQNAGIRERVAKNGWLAPSGFQSNPFEQIKTTKVALRAQLEPIKDFKIQLDANREITENYSEIFRYALDSIFDGDIFERVQTSETDKEARGYSPTRNGNFSISIVTIKTAFDKEDGKHRTGAFKNFEKYRTIIQQRMTATNPSKEAAYDINSQDVLVPAFLAAYTGQTAEGVSLSSFPKIPIPNWRIDYSGLGKMEGLKNTFSSFVINHQYVSKLTIGNFVSAYDYENVPYLNDNFSYPYATVRDSTGNFVPFYVFNDVTIDEQFSPLIGVNFRTKKRMTGKVEYRTSRAVGLNLSNQKIQEQNKKEVVFSFGYTTNNFKVPFKIEGKTVILRNDLNFRCDVSISDSKTTLRTLEEDGVITQGTLNVQIRPNVSYALNQKLQLQMYFERGINTPKISTSFKRTTTAFGVQLRFSLAQ